MAGIKKQLLKTVENEISQRHLNDTIPESHHTKLWAYIGQDFDKGIDNLAEETSIDKTQIIEFFADQGIREIKAGNSWLRNLWFDIFVVLLLGSLLLGVLFWLSIFLGTNNKQVVVKVSTGLPALHIIGESDIELVSQSQKPQSFSTQEDVIGRYTLEAIPFGAVLSVDQLSDVQLAQVEPGDLANRLIVSLSVATHTLNLAEPGYRTSLLFIPRDPAQTDASPHYLEDVIVLTAAQDDETASITIAVKEEDFDVFSQQLSVSDVFVMRSTTVNQPP
jgi:hypothetical protein